MTKIKILFCALALTGCSAAIQPTFDGGRDGASDGGSSDVDAHYDDAGTDAGPLPDPDSGPDDGLDLGPEDAGDPLDAGPAPCVSTVDPPAAALCEDGTCCTGPCVAGTCSAITISGTFCGSCFYARCPAGVTSSCDYFGRTCPCH